MAVITSVSSETTLSLVSYTDVTEDELNKADSLAMNVEFAF